MRTLLLKNSILLLLVLLLLTLPDCTKDDPNNIDPTENKQIEKLIPASVGGVLETSDSLTLTVPAYALPADGPVFLGRTGKEPSSVPNNNLTIVGRPVTIRIPSESILKTIQLSFPKPSSIIDTSIYSIFLFNGSTYFPVDYSVSGNKVVVLIDKINWESNEKKGTTLLSEIIIIGLIIKQTPPPSEMGLHKILIDNSGNWSFGSPSANSSSKVLLLIHGWTGNAKTWDVLLPKIKNETTVKYSELWTFVYNSSWSINQNAEKLTTLLKTCSNGSRIDIVAHSMGGLVARSMIEQNNGSQYIHRLITLGTPHKGSSLALLRYLFGGMVAYDNPLAFPLYNYFSQGFRDLNINSGFITELNKLTSPPIPYYLIAATNDPNATPRNGLEKTYDLCRLDQMLPDQNDGIVSLTSAKGLQNTITPENDINIPFLLAHLDMPEDPLIYQQVLNFLKDNMPSIVTNQVIDITSSTAVVGGNITSDGGFTVTERGVFWGTSQNPETTGTKFQIGSGLGLFSDSLKSLAPGTLYYVKAYAINSQGIDYGNEVSFETSSGNNDILFNPNLTYGTLSDVEGNTYKTIQIGNQTWMAENLKTTKYNDNTTIPPAFDNNNWLGLITPGYCWYTYGALYNWYAVDAASNGNKNICPTGWHVPTQIEWTTLTTFLGGVNIAGNKIKEAGTTHWVCLNFLVDNSNESGFTGLPGGYRNGAGFNSNSGLFGYWWSSSESDATSAQSAVTYSDNPDVSLMKNAKNSGYSVRCLKDN